MENFEKLCVCVEKFIPDGCKIDKNFFRQKNVTKNVFGGKKMSEIFFTNFKNKKNFKIFRELFFDFSFSKKQ